MENHELISKFLTGEISDAELIELKSWLEKDPENRKIFNLENEIWRMTDAYTSQNKYDSSLAWQKITERFAWQEQSEDIIFFKKNRFRLLAVVATIIIILLFGGLGFQLYRKASFGQQLNSQTIISSNIGEKSHIYLADSTEVFLNSKSVLGFDGSYNMRGREINLTGEAFFNVRSNPRKPFVVHIDNLVITATGTRFNVSAYSDDPRIEATLEEGQIFVSVSGKSVPLKEGEQLIYYRDTKELVLHQVVTKTYTAWKENELRFMDAPLAEIMRKIGRKYNVDIEIEGQQIFNLKYTATFMDESIEEIMHMLKMVSPIEYKIYRHPASHDQEYIRPKVVISASKSFSQTN